MRVGEISSKDSLVHEKYKINRISSTSSNRQIALKKDFSKKISRK